MDTDTTTTRTRRGRPAKGRSVKRTIRMTPEVAIWLEAQAARLGPRSSVDDAIEAWAMGTPTATPEPVPADQGWRDEVQEGVAARLSR